MTDPLDAMLGALKLPEPAPGFADRIVARATALPQEAALPAPPRRRDRRGAWLRRHRILGGFIGANLLAAGAVAAAIATGVEIRDVPLIAPVIEAIAPAPPPPQLARPKPKPAPAPPVEAAETPPALAPLPPMPGLDARMARRDAIAAEVRAREAAGLPVPPRLRRQVALHEKQRQAYDLRRAGAEVPMELKTEIVRERLDLARPAVRARVIERVEARRAAGLPVPPALDAAVPPLGATPEPLRPAAAPPAAEAVSDPAPGPDAADKADAAPAPAEATPAAAAAERLRRLDPAQRRQLLERLRARRTARAGRP